LQPEDFTDDKHKALVVWDAAFISAKYQFEKVDELLVKVKDMPVESRVARRILRSGLFKGTTEIHIFLMHWKTTIYPSAGAGFTNSLQSSWNGPSFPSGTNVQKESSA
jgi:hypothetical protein